MAFAAVAVVAIASPAAAAVSSGTTVQASPSTATTGQSVDLTATVTCAGDPSGGLGVTFFDGSNLLTTVAVGTDGTASYQAGFTSTGTHTITAAYNGNDNCDASNGTTTVDVTAAPAPPAPTSGLCLLTCNSLINIRIDNVGNINNIYNIYNDFGSSSPGGRH
ncbi:Ig-like domain-containing protein [Actinospica durhamensis]|uniref:Ig-like domain-containing protein n=1 Tax=Actinospica durhamensis TaxID=1508375 RepID=UPI001FEBE148|nr:Ig-like domain-containing protein [Actinospica durhamensis]